MLHIPGSETVGSDYDPAIDELVTFPVGATAGGVNGQQCFDFLPINDPMEEQPETIALTASFVVVRADHLFQAGSSTAFIDIIDDDFTREFTLEGAWWHL